MTPLEALSKAMENRDEDRGWIESPEFYEFEANVLFTRLRALGFVIVPERPAGAAIERMAMAMCQDLGWCDWHEVPDDKQDYYRRRGQSVCDVNGPFKTDFVSMTRAAYAALVGPDEGERT